MFTFWANPEMTAEVTSPYPIVYNGTGSVDIVMYYGSNDADEILTSATSEPITLMPINKLEKWESARYYKVGDIIEPVIANGQMYKCTIPGTSGHTEPEWQTKPAAVISSGTAQFISYGAKFVCSDVKMALSRTGLDTADAGGSISLGQSMRGGAPIAIYIRITNRFNNLRSDTTDPCISIGTNKVILTKRPI